MLNKRPINQPRRQLVTDPEWGVAVTAVLVVSGCFPVQVSLWGLGRMRRSGQAVIRLSLWSLRVAPCPPASTRAWWEGSCRRKQPCFAHIQGQRALLASNSAASSACKRQATGRALSLASLLLNLFSAEEKSLGGALLGKKCENRKPQNMTFSWNGAAGHAVLKKNHECTEPQPDMLILGD